MSKVTWKLISNTPDYISDCGEFIAIYRKTVKGYGYYWVFFQDAPKSKRTMKNAIAVGGLPEHLGDSNHWK